MSSIPTKHTSQRPPRLAYECAVGELFGRAPIYDAIFSCVSPHTLVRIGRSCRIAYAASKDFSHRAYNIHRHLSRYLSEPLNFRSLQARTGTLIAGSNALQFLDRTFYPESDMDLYVHPGHVREVLDYLVEREGYKFRPDSTQPGDYREIVSDEWDGTQIRDESLDDDELLLYYQIRGVESVLSIEKRSPDGLLKIQLIACKTSPFDAIINFHSTCVMNFIAFDAAYSLYPVGTFEKRETLSVWRARPLHDLTVVIKYGQRGFAWISTVPTGTSPQNSPFYPFTDRTVGDCYTWKLPLDTRGVALRSQMNPSSSVFQCDPVIYNGWALERVQHGMGTVYKTIQSSVFRYNYTTTNYKLNFKLWLFAIEQGFLSRILLERNLLEKESWPWFDAELASCWETFKHDFLSFIRRDST
ncbi:hypothetical protein DFJ58DRAFT_770327 [Suillus subalutaceus]|uniref:uncharacterized protein n=1 Tax=Suillus subalutaceus TaxID=48586 RepID=UPI001B85D439|nr:uncharacterized protein DFJ58DRAFT_770327 [Suillus subalutaceus]KAG1865802.1 hypothetical protein DFJ58DRAFT_770327 [Suillus subalutaceus]